MWGFFLGVIFVLGLFAAFAAGTYFGWVLHKNEVDRDKSKWEDS